MKIIAVIYIALSLSFTSHVLAQTSISNTGTYIIDNDNPQSPSVIRLTKENRQSVTVEKNDNISAYSDVMLHQYTNSFFHPQKTEQKFPGTIVSSFNSNIHFGGFWDKYAIVNFTPQLDIMPFDFIRIYANHSSSIYIPIKEIKSYFKSIVLKGAAVMGIENSVRIVFHSYPMMQSVVGFVLKNVVMALLNKTENKLSQPLEFKNYYYSVNIMF